MSDTFVPCYEVNFLTIEEMTLQEKILPIEAEFDFVRMCQSMIKPFEYQARESLIISYLSMNLALEIL